MHVVLIALALCLPAWAVDSRAIDRALAHANLKGAEIGVEVYSLTKNEIVYTRNPHTPLIPASNNKLVTTASALHHLGVDARLSTCVYALGHIEGNVLHGDLVIRGGGDPCLSERYYPEDALAPLKELAHAVVQGGVNAVSGALLLDDGIFDRDYVAPGWPADQLNRHYCAPVSAFSLFENLLWIEVVPADRAGQSARIRLDPACAPFVLNNEVRTTSKKNQNLIHITRPQPGGRLTVSGKTYSGNPPSRFSVPVRDPAAYFGAVFNDVLAAGGVRVAEGYRVSESSVDYTRGNCRLLGSIDHDLIQVVILTNKESNNHFAEQLFKLAGWKALGKGTFATGAAAARKTFAELGVTDPDEFTMVDGSGLSRENHFSPHTLVRLLTAMYQSPLRDPYLRSLPISGVDGSLEKRMVEAPYASRVRGKTGWIRDVSALSGYCQSLSGEIFAFSILFNDYRGGNSTMKSIQDSICRILVDD